MCLSREIYYDILETAIGKGNHIAPISRTGLGIGNHFDNLTDFDTLPLWMFHDYFVRKQRAINAAASPEHRNSLYIIRLLASCYFLQYIFEYNFAVQLHLCISIMQSSSESPIHYPLLKSRKNHQSILPAIWFEHLGLTQDRLEIASSTRDDLEGRTR